MDTVEGIAVLMGDDISTDDISPTSAFSENPQEIRDSCFMHIYPGIRLDGTVIVAGRNFGWGSYRESAALCLLYSGVKAVIARSFGYGMYRNLINLGIPAFIGEPHVSDGEILRIDVKKRALMHDGMEESLEISEAAMEIMMKGGLLNVP
jgi:3-isopropylmalate/(R)-2-methylmalate dehydratase small subunit